MGQMKYDVDGINSHAVNVGKIGNEIEQKLGELLALIQNMPEVWSAASGESAAQAATDIKKAGDLVAKAVAGHGTSVQKAGQIFAEGDAAVAKAFQSH
jgi:WXG100 family type VII secretion target